MRTMSGALRGAVPLVACAAALAACSSSTGAHHAAGTTTTTTTAPTVPSAPSSAGTAGGSSGGSSSSSAGTTACTASALSGSVSGTQGGAGVLELTVALRNGGGSTCTLNGYAGLQLVGAGGSQLETTVHQGGPLAFESVAPTTVTLAAGQRAYLNIGFSDVPSGSTTTCPTATTLQLVPPGDSGHLSVPVQIQPCGGNLVESAVFAAGSPATQTTAPPTGG